MDYLIYYIYKQPHKGEIFVEKIFDFYSGAPAGRYLSGMFDFAPKGAQKDNLIPLCYKDVAPLGQRQESQGSSSNSMHF